MGTPRRFIRIPEISYTVKSLKNVTMGVIFLFFCRVGMEWPSCQLYWQWFYKEICNCVCNMYTYDLQIYHSRPRDMPSECIQKVNCDLRKFFEWSRVNFMRSNSAKSMVLFIYREHLLGQSSSGTFFWLRCHPL
jgi:hypothetical protein